MVLNFIEIDKLSAIIIAFSNILIFITLQTLLFWFIVSKSVENTIDDKTILINDIIIGVPELEQNLDLFIESEQYKYIVEKATGDKILRDEFNKELLLKWMTFPYSFVIIVLVISLLSELYFSFRGINKSHRFDRVDAMIMSTVFLAFVTELIFYYIVISRSRNIPDMDIIRILLNLINNEISELTPKNLPTTPPTPTTPPIPIFPPPLP